MMSVLTHLTDTASKAVLSTTENSSITTSISTLKSRLDDWFGTVDVKEHFKFGSYTRDTILPRKIDDNSDVDYMVVFKDDTKTPQTYLDRLRRFVENKYSTSEIKQEHPTIVLSLSHIRFELVPAVPIWSGYNIPAPASGFVDWIATYPNSFNTTLSDANKRHSYQIKPMARLVKYWNAQSGYVFGSYLLEKALVDNAWATHSSLKGYLFAAFDYLNVPWDAAQWRKDKLARAKEIIKNTRDYEAKDWQASAETEIKKLLPIIS